jgi:hypothetical protein
MDFLIIQFSLLSFYLLSLTYTSLPVWVLSILPNLKSQQFLSCTALQQGRVNLCSYTGTVSLFSFGFFVFVYVSWFVIRVALKSNWLPGSTLLFIRATFAFVTTVCGMGLTDQAASGSDVTFYCSCIPRETCRVDPKLWLQFQMKLGQRYIKSWSFLYHCYTGFPGLIEDIACCVFIKLCSCSVTFSVKEDWR